MDYPRKTKEELIKELERLRQEKKDSVLSKDKQLADLTEANRKLQGEISRLNNEKKVFRNHQDSLWLALQCASVGIHIIEYDRKTDKRKLLWCNQRFVELSGYSREDLMAADNFAGMMRPLTAPAEMEAFAKDFEPGKACGGEATWLRPDGKDNYFEWTMTPVKTEGDKTYLIGVDSDITHRKQMEEFLKESEDKYKNLYTKVRDAIMVFDAQTNRFVDVNPAALELYGYSREEFLKLKLSDITAEPDKTTRSIEQTLAGKLDYIPLRYHRKKDGTIFPVEITAGVFPWENRQVLCGVIRDRTEHKQVESALQDSLQRYRKLVETIPHGIAEVDLTGTITFSNTAHHKIHGYPDEGLVGTDIWDFQVSANEKKLLKQYIRKLIEEQPVPAPYITKNRKKDGSIVVVQVDWNYKRNEKGELLGFISVITDITKRKEAEDALREIHAQLEHRVVMRTRELSEANTKLERQIYERKQAEKQLLKYQKQLRALASELSLAEQRERRRIASDIHDHVAQTLVLSVLKLESLRETGLPNEADEELTRICLLIENVIDNTRSLTFDLDSPILYKAGLEAAIEEWLKEQVGKRHGISTEFYDDGKSKILVSSQSLWIS